MTSDGQHYAYAGYYMGRDIYGSVLTPCEVAVDGYNDLYFTSVSYGIYECGPTLQPLNIIGMPKLAGGRPLPPAPEWVPEPSAAALNLPTKYHTLVVMGTVVLEPPGNLFWPVAIAFGPGGRLCAVDAETGYAQVFDTSGQMTAIIALANEDGYAYNTSGIAMDDQRRVFVSDAPKNCVEQYDLKGNLVQTIGAKGDGPGQLLKPGAVRVSASGNIYVLDRGNHRVAVYKPDGSFAFLFGAEGAGALRTPVGMALDRAGNAFVRDEDHVSIFDSYGTYLGSFGNQAVYDPRLLGDARDPKLAATLQKNMEYQARMIPTAQPGISVARNGTVYTVGTQGIVMYKLMP